MVTTHFYKSLRINITKTWGAFNELIFNGLKPLKDLNLTSLNPPPHYGQKSPLKKHVLRLLSRPNHPRHMGLESSLGCMIGLA